jgi:hypothetical protein
MIGAFSYNKLSLGSSPAALPRNNYELVRKNSAQNFVFIPS